jgi:hypothetical protein
MRFFMLRCLQIILCGIVIAGVLGCGETKKASTGKDDVPKETPSGKATSPAPPPLPGADKK